MFLIMVTNLVEEEREENPEREERQGRQERQGRREDIENKV